MPTSHDNVESNQTFTGFPLHNIFSMRLLFAKRLLKHAHTCVRVGWDMEVFLSFFFFFFNFPKTHPFFWFLLLTLKHPCAYNITRFSHTLDVTLTFMDKTYSLLCIRIYTHLRACAYNKLVPCIFLFLTNKIACEILNSWCEWNSSIC